MARSIRSNNFRGPAPRITNSGTIAHSASTRGARQHWRNGVGDPTRQVRWADPEVGNQEFCFRYGPAPICASGGFGASKTYAFCLKVLYLSFLYPGNRGVISRRVWRELEKTTMATFFKICPPEAYKYGRRSDSDKILILNNGSQILWQQLETEEDATILRGIEINWFLFDQAEEIQEDMFSVALTRLGRWDQATVPDSVIAANGGYDAWPYKSEGRCIPPTYAMLTCNPDIELHWLYRMFHPDSPEHSEMRPELDLVTGNETGRMTSYKQQGYRMVFMSSLHNRYLTQQNKRSLLNNDPTFVRRYVHGQWGIPEGVIHNVPRACEVPGTPEIVEYLRQHCTLYRILDHGDSSPTCCAWAAVDREGNIIFYREYYMPGKAISDHRASIYALSEHEHELYRDNIADPSIFIKMQVKQGGKWCVADEYADVMNTPTVEDPDTRKDYRELARATAITWSRGDNNEPATRNRINEYLKVDPQHTNPFTKEKGSPRIFFLTRSDAYPNGANMLLRELRSQRRIKLDSVGGRTIWSDDRDDAIPDHAYDCIRYMIASRKQSAVVPARAYPSRSFNTIRKAHIDFVRKGGYRKLQRDAAAQAQALRALRR